MPLQKQVIEFPLAFGVNQKPHPLALRPPLLSRCDNAVFDEVGSVAKRLGHVSMGVAVDPVGTLAASGLASASGFGTSLATGAYAPTANSLVLATVVNYRSSGTPTLPTASGNGLTWVQVATVTVTSNDPEGLPEKRITLFRAMGPGPTSTAFTADFGGVSQAQISISVRQWTGTDTSGTNGSGAIQQTATNSVTGAGASSLTVTLSALQSSAGVDASFTGAGPVTPEASWTEVHEVGTAVLETQVRTLTSDNTPSATFGSAQYCAGIAAEIKPKPAVSLTNIRGLATRDLPDGSLPELVAFGERDDLPGQRKLFSWYEYATKWMERGDYEGVRLTSVQRTQAPQNQHPCDLAVGDPSNSGERLVAWLDSVVGTVMYQLFDSTGVALCEPQAVTVSSAVKHATIAFSAHLFLIVCTDSGSNSVRGYLVDSSNILASGTHTITEFSVGTSIGVSAPFDLVRLSSTRAVCVYPKDTSGYAIADISSSGTSSATAKARTTDADSAIAVAYESNSSKLAIVRSDGTNIKGDIVSSVAGFSDAFTDVTLQSLGGGDLGRVAMAFRQVAETDGSYQAVVHYTRTAETGPFSMLRTFGTDGVARTVAGFTGNSTGICHWSVPATRAFARSGKVYFTVISTSELVAQQRTYVVVREDGVIVARFGTWAAPDPGAQSSDRTSPLPQWDNFATDKYASAAAVRGKAAIYDDQFPDTGVTEVTLDWSSYLPYRAVQLGGCLFMPGGLVTCYDGLRPYESGFFHAVTVENIATPAGGSLAAGSYRYRIIPEWRYATGEVERGSWVDTEVATAAASDKVTFDIHCYATTRKTRLRPNGTLGPPKIVLAVYRTKVDGAAFYLNSSIDPADTGLSNNKHVQNNPNSSHIISYSDDMVDATLATKERLYTDFTPIDHVAPEACSVMAVGQGRIFLAGHADPYLVTYSKIWQAGEAVHFHDAYQIVVPAAGGRVTGLHVTDTGLLIFCERRVYFAPGTGPDNTGAGDSYGEPQLLTSDVGCIDGGPVVQVPDGWMFPTDKGIRLLDRGYSVKDIGAPVIDDARARIDGDDLRAAFVSPAEHRVVFVSDTTASLVYDYLVNQWSEWTQPVGVAAVTWGDRHVYATSTAVHKSRLAGESNAKRDSGSAYNLDLELAAIPLGELNGFGRCWELSLLGEWVGTHGLRVRLAYDGSGSYADDQTWTVDTTTYQVRIRPSRQKFRSVKVRLTDTDLGTLNDSFKAVALAAVVGIKGKVTRQPSTRSI